MTNKSDRRQNRMPARQVRTACQLLAFCFCLAFGSPAAAQLEHIKDLAEYSTRVNKISEDFNNLAYRALQLDELAYAVLDGHVTEEFARRRLRTLSVELRAAYERLSNELGAIPEPPGSLVDPQIHRRLKYVRSTARHAQEMTHDFISSGEELLDSAISGDLSVSTELETRTLRLMLGHLERQHGSIELQKANEEEGSWIYHQYSAISASNGMMIIFLQAAIDFRKTSDFRAIDAIQSSATSLYQVGRHHVDAGREDAMSRHRQLSAYVSNTVLEQHLVEILVDMLASNVPDAFDVEERILMEVFDYVTTPPETLSDDDIQYFMSKMQLLENERTRLTLERQRMIADLQ